jgi:hypothetical protein
MIERREREVEKDREKREKLGGEREYGQIVKERVCV